jgi:hypothetical protein
LPADKSAGYTHSQPAEAGFGEISLTIDRRAVGQKMKLSGGQVFLRQVLIKALEKVTCTLLFYPDYHRMKKTARLAPAASQSISSTKEESER